jgi:BolA protein
MSDRISRIEARIREGLAVAHLEIEDESHLHAGHAGAKGGAGHYRALVVSERFEGLSRVARQRLIFEAVGEMMGPDIHALAMRTLTPSEWSGEGVEPAPSAQR